jgi:replicative DNA helicase
MLDEHFQDMVLGCMQRVPEFCSVCCQHVEPPMFEGVIRHNLAKMMIDFWNRYGTTVGDSAFVEVMKDLIKHGKIKEDDLPAYAETFKKLKETKATEHRYVAEKLIKFIKQQKIKELMERSVSKLLPREDYATIEQEMAKIANISTLNKVEGYDYFDEKNIDEREKTRFEESMMRRVGISTGIKALDDQLFWNGFFEKELYVIMAGPKRGKTMSLLYFANAAAINGHNAVYFSCEISKRIAYNRMDAMNSNIETKQLDVRHKQVSKQLRAIPKPGKLFIFEYPTKSLTVEEVKRQVDKLRLEQGIDVDVIFTDYLDIMKPARRQDSKWDEQASIAEDLRGMAGELVVPVVTATQVNRSGAGKTLTKGSDVSGSYEKIMIGDEIITLSATDDEVLEGKLRIHLSESRNSGTATINISTMYNYGRFYGEYLGMEA